MSQVSPVFHTEVTVSIDLKTSFRVGTSIPQIQMSMIVGNQIVRLIVEGVNKTCCYLGYMASFRCFQCSDVSIIQMSCPVYRSPLKISSHLICSCQMMFSGWMFEKISQVSIIQTVVRRNVVGMPFFVVFRRALLASKHSEQINRLIPPVERINS